MSIIDDALKKTQANIEKNVQKTPSSLYEKVHKNLEAQQSPQEQTSSLQSSKPKKKSKKTIIMTFFVPALMLVIIAILLNFIYQKAYAPLAEITQRQESPKKQKVVKKILPLKKEKSLPPQPSASVETMKAIPPSNASKSLHLSGIMMMGDFNVAIINDDIYKAGETVGDMTITKITLKQVYVQNGNETFILDVRESQ